MTAAAALRVCLVTSAYRPYPSGVSEHVAHLAAALADMGHDVEVMTTRFRDAPDAETGPVPVRRLGRAVLVPANGSYATLPVGRDLPGQVERLLRARRPDVVHCHGVFWPEISYWAIRKSRSVNVVTFLSSGPDLTDRGSRAYRRLFSGQLDKIHGRIAISQRARRTYAPYVPGDCRIIPSGVDTGRFRPDRAPLQGRPGRPNVLFVGRLDRRKGALVLVRAMALVRRRMPDAHLTVVGDGPTASEVRASVDALGLGASVTLAGRVPNADLPRYYAGADVYCSPALGGESFGIVLLEAMAAGAAVVASDIPGYDETVDRGRTGLLVPRNDPPALAAALLRLLEDRGLRGRLVAAARMKAERHAWPVVAERTVAYYRALIDGSTGDGAPGT